MPINMSLQCKSLAQTQAFYKDVLDFDVFEGEMQTATVRYADCSLIFFQRPDDVDPQLTGTAYLFIPDVDSYYELVKNRVELEWPLQDMSYGTREFAVKDCNGYRLAFAQDRTVT